MSQAFIPTDSLISSMKLEFGRTQKIQEAPIEKILTESKIPDDVIDLGQGVPFYGPPKEAVLAASQALDKESGFKYSPDAGTASLREAIVEKLAIQNGINADAEKNVMVTAGCNQAFVNSVLTVTSPGDHVILLAPYYFNHVMAVQLAGCKPVIVDTDRDYQPQVERIAKNVTKSARAIVLVSPNNPTGAVYGDRQIKAIARICCENQI